MSLHEKPLTLMERKGLEAHHLPIDVPSQLSDAFRLGMAYALGTAVRMASETVRICPTQDVACCETSTHCKECPERL